MKMYRRHFLKSAGVLTAGLFFNSDFSIAEEPSFDPNFVVLLADTHCGPSRKHQIEFMKKSVQDILAFKTRPKNVLIYGDFAFLYGRKEDYLLLKELVAPLDEAGIVWTNCMGNHDRRDFFAEVFPKKAQASLMKDRLVFNVETPNADFLLLDSLIQSDNLNKWITPGEILSDQKEWLDEFLKKQTKPIFVGAHHPLNETKIDDLLKKHDCVAGYIHGHNHYWLPYQFEGVDVLTLPSNGHWGDIGYTCAKLNSNGAEFKLTMKDYLVVNRTPEFQPNPKRQEELEKKSGALWTRKF